MQERDFCKSELTTFSRSPSLLWETKRGNLVTLKEDGEMFSKQFSQKQRWLYELEPGMFSGLLWGRQMHAFALMYIPLFSPVKAQSDLEHHSPLLLLLAATTLWGRPGNPRVCDGHPEGFRGRSEDSNPGLHDPSPTLVHYITLDLISVWYPQLSGGRVE